MKSMTKSNSQAGWWKKSFLVTLSFLLVGGVLPGLGAGVAKAEPIPQPDKVVQIVAGTGEWGTQKTNQARGSQFDRPTDIEVIEGADPNGAHFILFSDLGNEETSLVSGNALPFFLPGVDYINFRFKNANNQVVKAIDFTYQKNSNTDSGLNQLYFTGYVEGTTQLNIFRTTGSTLAYDPVTNSLDYQVVTILEPNSLESSGGLATTVTGDVYAYDNFNDKGLRLDFESLKNPPFAAEPADFMNGFIYPQSVEDIAVYEDTMYVLSNQGYINKVNMITQESQIIDLNIYNEFNNPKALTVDSSGKLYVADTGNHRVVWLIIPEQSPNDYTVYPIAGTGIAGKGEEGGKPIETQLNSPEGVAVADDGTVYISDTGNHRVLQLSDPQNAVASVTAQASDASADVSWDAADGAVYYEIYKYAGDSEPSNPQDWEYAGSTWTQSSPPSSATNFTVTGLSNGQSYVFAVKAKSMRSTSKFTFSDPVTPIGAVTAPERPSNVSAVAGNASATINWNASENATSYIVYQVQAQYPPEDLNMWTEVAKDVTSKSYVATGLENGKPYIFAVKAVGPGGVSTFSQSSNAVVPVASTTPPVTTPSPGETPSAPVTAPPASNTTIINVNVQDDKMDNGSVVTSLAITRTKGTDGTTKDALQLTPAKATEIINLLKASGSKTAAIVLPDAGDEVSQWDLTVPGAASKLLTGEGIELVILNPNVRITVPASSLTDLTDDLYFRLIPVKSTATSTEIQARALANPEIVAAANGGSITVVGRPMTIETNLQSRPVTLILPLPAGSSFTAAQQKKLGVYIEHSDGTKQLVRGTVVTQEDGRLGIEITVNRFSTFTVVNVSNWGSTLIASPYIMGYANGSFKPAQNITRAELAAIVGRITGVTEGTATFSDVKNGSWASTVVGPAAASGIMTGYSDGTFKPNASITRGELASALAKLLPQSGLDASGQAAGFSDLAASHWAAAAAAQLQAAGVVTGYADGSFKPEQNVTRAEAVTMINRLVGLDGSMALPGAAEWSDVTESYWAYDAVRAASMQR